MINVETKLDELGRAFESFKAANDRELAELKQSGHASAETRAKVDRINAALDQIQGTVREAEAQAKEDRRKLERLEAEAARLSQRPEAVERELQEARAFFRTRASLRKEPEPASVNVETYRAYRAAFLEFARKGHESIAPEIRAALSVGSDPAGGYLVPPDMTGRIVERIYETSPIRQYASAQTIGTDALEGILDLDEAGSEVVSETGTRNETTTPELGVWRIPVHEQSAEPRATLKILEDAVIDIGAWLERKLAERFARQENLWSVSGNGVNRWRGFLTYAAGTPTASAWSQIQQIVTGVDGGFVTSSATANAGDCLLDALYALKAPHRARAAWAMNRLTAARVRKIKDADGNYVWAPGIQQGQPATLMGYPVAEFEDMPNVTTGSLSIAVADWAEAYQIVDRIGLTILRDQYTSKGLMKFYGRKRSGGDVVNTEAIKLIKFSVS